jgi:TatA/E family protein of Tat protein translocase
MGPLGWQETIFIFILALLIFGPKKLPELGKTIGKAMTEFRRASSELKATWNREMTSIEREAEAIKEETRKISTEISSTYYDSGTPSTSEYDYNYGYEDSYNYGADSTTPSDSNPTDSSTDGASAVPGADQAAPEPGSPPEEQLPATVATAVAAEPGAESVEPDAARS